MSGIVHVEMLDKNKNVIRKSNGNTTKSSNTDVYSINRIVLKSFEEYGQLARCVVFDSADMETESSSEYYQMPEIDCKCLQIGYIIGINCDSEVFAE